MTQIALPHQASVQHGYLDGIIFHCHKLLKIIIQPFGSPVHWIDQDKLLNLTL